MSLQNRSPFKLGPFRTHGLFPALDQLPPKPKHVAAKPIPRNRVDETLIEPARNNDHDALRIENVRLKANVAQLNKNIAQLKAKNETLEKNKNGLEHRLAFYRCKICLDKDACMLMSPCGHIACCEVCMVTARFTNCPVCRTGIAKHERVFHP